MTTYNIPISRVTFDGMSFSIKPLACDISQSIGQHDTINLRMSPVQGISLATGAYKTISFSWDVNSAGRFFGYVTDYTVGPRGDVPGTVITITAMGPTMVLKAGRPRFYTDSTVADVVSRVVADAQLGFIDEYGKDHYVWPQLAQTDESDWEFINDMAMREGSQLLCADGVVRLIDPMNVLSRTEPVMLLSNNQPQTGLPQAGIFDYQATVYSDRLPKQYTPTISFLNNGVPEVVPGTSGAYSYQENSSGTVPVRNATEAELCQVRLPVDWEHQAQIRVSGSAKLGPGGVVFVKGGDEPATAEPYDGYWYITDAQHTLTKNSYQTNLSLARVVSASRRIGIPHRNWWLDPRGRPTLVLNNLGNWISTWR